MANDDLISQINIEVLQCKIKRKMELFTRIVAFFGILHFFPPVYPELVTQLNTDQPLIPKFMLKLKIECTVL